MKRKSLLVLLLTLVFLLGACDKEHDPLLEYQALMLQASQDATQLAASLDLGKTGKELEKGRKLVKAGKEKMDKAFGKLKITDDAVREAADELYYSYGKFTEALLEEKDGEERGRLQEEHWDKLSKFLRLLEEKVYTAR